MNFPCIQRNCTKSLAHFYPKTLRPQASRRLWARDVHTWLPFHIHRKRFAFPSQGDDRVMCTTVLMDEERMVFSTCLDNPDLMDPTSWNIIHLLHDQNMSVGGAGNGLIPVAIDEDTEQHPVTLHDQICRLCKAKPHTDAHILLECTTHPKVIELRRTLLINRLHRLAHNDPELYNVWCRRSSDDLLHELMARRDVIRFISLLAREINEIYAKLPRCSELVWADQENPSSRLFVTKV